MPRKQIPNSSEHPYHVTARCHNREWFDLPLETVSSIFDDYLYVTKHEFDFRIHAFVLMPNHFHMLTSTPQANISPGMQYLMNQTSREITRLSGRINQTFGNRHHKTLITTDHYFTNCYKYVYRNPVKAGLCTRVEDYKYSTLNGLLGDSQLVVPVERDTLLFTPHFDERTLSWLNRKPDAQSEEDVRKALRKGVFALPRAKNNNGRNILEDFLL